MKQEINLSIFSYFNTLTHYSYSVANELVGALIVGVGNISSLLVLFFVSVGPNLKNYKCLERGKRAA